MRLTRYRLYLAPFIYGLCALGVAAYFAYAAVAGEHGRLRRAELEAKAASLDRRAEKLEAHIAAMENLTKRLSDDYLDLDLLDERARKVLGLVRADEIVIR